MRIVPRRTQWTLAAVSLTTACVFVTPALAAPTPRLVIKEDFPDPDIVEASGTFYGYATNADRNVPSASATDLDGPWRQQPDAFPTDQLPGWIGPSPNGSLNIWAPDVSRRADGSFLLYYSAFHAASHRQCVAAAVSDKPLGPFHPTSQDPLICENGQADVIDPQSFTDRDGTRYLLFKDSHGKLARGGPSTIRIRKVSADGLTPLGPDVPLLHDDRPEENGVVEAPALVRRPEGYVLFYSANEFNGGHYFINYATANTLTGPFTKANGALVSHESTGGAITDPGGQMVVSGAGSDHLIFHGDLAGPGGPRGVYTAPLRWDGLRPVLG